MSTAPGDEMQVEGGNNTVSTPENDELIAGPSGPSAPFNPEAEEQQNVQLQESQLSSEQTANLSEPTTKHPLDGWWWKILIVLFFLFVMILFFVWIGPSFIYGDKNDSDTASNQNIINTMDPTFFPTFFPTLEPTLSPITITPTISPSLPTTSPIIDPTYSPSLNPTLRPTMKPTYCPSEEGSYLDDAELCDITDSTLESCFDVDSGHKYEYDMDPTGCQSSITCKEYSYCFNNTHWSDGVIIYEGIYHWYGIGETVSCTIRRNCDDASCQTCSKSNRYQLNIIIISMSLMIISLLL